MLTVKDLRNSHREEFVNLQVKEIQETLFEKIYRIRQQNKGSEYLKNKKIEQVKEKNIVHLIRKGRKYVFEDEMSLGIYKGYNAANCGGEIYFSTTQKTTNKIKPFKWNQKMINEQYYFGKPQMCTLNGISTLIKPGEQSQLKTTF